MQPEVEDAFNFLAAQIPRSKDGIPLLGATADGRHETWVGEGVHQAAAKAEERAKQAAELAA